MNCEKCGKPMMIIQSNSRFANDDTPDKDTELWNDQILACTNTACQDYAWHGFVPQSDSDKPRMEDAKLTRIHPVRVV